MSGKSTKRDVLEIVAAIVLAYLFYQGLSLATGTSLPIVSVVSGSMHHSGDFDEWWLSHGAFYQDNGIAKEQFREFPFPNGMFPGDLLFVVDGEADVGDVVIYRQPGTGIVIVHRVLETDGIVVTKGDFNRQPDAPISRDDILGKAVFAVPALGYPRLALFALGV